MLVHDRSTRTEWAKELTGYWRELLFWMLLLPAFGALGSIRPRRQVAGLVEACAFLLVAISSAGKLKSLGLEFANWNRICRRAAASCIGAGLLAGVSIVAVARLSQQPLGTESGWNKAMLAITLGPVLEEVIFRGYLLTAALLLTRHLSLSGSGSAACSIRGHSRSILDCASHDSRDNRASALLHCSYGLPLRLAPSPAWIDRGSCSCPCHVQPGTLPQLLVRDFALNDRFLAVRDGFWKIPRILACMVNSRRAPKETISGRCGVPSH